MNPTNLLSHTIRRFMAVFLVLLIIAFGLFYLVMRIEVTQSIDEILSNRRNNIIETIRTKAEVPLDNSAFTDFEIRRVESATGVDVFTDTLIFEKTDQEFDEYRKLSTSFSFEGKRYELKIVKAHLETEEIVTTIVISLASILFLLWTGLYLVTRYYSGKLWSPFYKTLDELRKFEVEKPDRIVFEPSGVLEFDELGRSLTELTERVQRSFINQKQFTENASHEMQTPLAVIQNHLELLINDPSLTEAQSAKIKTLLDTIQKLAKLNKSLLLLSKIENQQFPEREKVELRNVVENILSYFEGHLEELQVTLDLHTCQVEGNLMLIEILVTNLIKNAFHHNKKKGLIKIRVGGRKLEIINSSDQQEIPQQTLFERFSKHHSAREGWGLGLSIAKTICDLNSWGITYSFANNEHTFRVNF